MRRNTFEGPFPDFSELCFKFDLAHYNTNASSTIRSRISSRKNWIRYWPLPESQNKVVDQFAVAGSLLIAWEELLEQPYLICSTVYGQANGSITILASVSHVPWGVRNRSWISSINWCKAFVYK